MPSPESVFFSSLHFLQFVSNQWQTSMHYWPHYAIISRVNLPFYSHSFYLCFSIKRCKTLKRHLNTRNFSHKKTPSLFSKSVHLEIICTLCWWYNVCFFTRTGDQMTTSLFSLGITWPYSLQLFYTLKCMWYSWMKTMTQVQLSWKWPHLTNDHCQNKFFIFLLLFLPTFSQL